VHYQTLVPVIAATDPREQIRIWAEGMTAESEWVRFARSVLPIGEMHLTMHEPFYTSVDLNTFDGWRQLINDIRTLRTMENGKGYYYGAFHRANLTGLVGLGFIGYPVSIGLSQDDTFAHEVGHNMSLAHAPCGGAGGADPRFPYRDGSTGVWGYNPAGGGIIDPDQYKDLMGYCNPSWVSDYSFEKALDFRVRTEIRPGGGDPGGVDPVDARRPAEQTLLLRGTAVRGKLVLDPAFLVETRPVLPDGDGPYRLEGVGSGGRIVFSFDFTPTPLEFGGGGFLFAVPYNAESDGALERVVLSGPEGEFVLGPSSARPMAILINRGNGQVRAILRDWNGGLNLLDGNTEIMVSDGWPDGSR